MADYYSILSKTISRLPANTPENRNTVYEKARGAIEKQLRGLNPAPPESAIQAQLKSLEEAATVIEAEYGAPPPTDPEPESDLAAEMAAILGTDQSPASAATNEPVSPSQPLPALEPQQDAVLSQPSPESVPPAVATSSEVPPPPSSTPIAPPAAEPIPEPVAASAAPEVPDAVAPPIPQAPPTLSFESDVISPEPQAQLLGADTFEADEEKSGGFGRLVAALLLLGVVGGSGYALWQNRDSLAPIISGLIGSSTEQADEKEPVRIGQDGQDEVVQQEEAEPQPQEQAQTQPENEVVTPTDQLEQSPASDETETAQEAPVAPPQEENNEPEQEQAAVSDDSSSEENSAAGNLPIGEVAYLYEEGTAGSGATRTNASVVWSLGQEAPNEGAPPEPVILGRMQVPNQGIDLDIKIRRNTDPGLSASHLIEMRFELPDEFAGQSINAIARFVLKGTEEERGEPLVAVPAKVDDGYFLIALDNLPQATEVNTRLLRDGQWIDIPVSYQTGKRALVTLEKGGTGERVFTEAFDTWKNLSGS